MEDKIEFKFSNSFKSAGKYLMFFSPLFGAAGIFMQVSLIDFGIYVIGLSIVMLIPGVIFYTGFYDNYVLSPPGRKIFHYKKRFYSKSTEEIPFSRIKRIEIQAEVTSRARKRPGTGIIYDYWWSLNVITEAAGVLRVTDPIKGQREEPPEFLSEKANRMGKVIGCSAVITAPYFSSSKNIYSPEMEKALANLSESVDEAGEYASNFGDFHCNNKNDFAALEHDKSNSASRYDESVKEVVMPGNEGSSIKNSIVIFLVSSFFIAFGLLGELNLLRGWKHNFDFPVIIMFIVYIIMILLGLGGYYLIFLASSNRGD